MLPGSILGTEASISTSKLGNTGTTPVEEEDATGGSSTSRAAFSLRIIKNQQPADG